MTGKTKFLSLTALVTILHSPVLGQDFVFDDKQPMNPNRMTVSEPVVDDIEWIENLPPAKFVFADGFDENSPEMFGWENDPMSGQHFFYGAVAASGTDYGWWADNFHSIEAARAHVLEWCNVDVPEGETPCYIVAEIHPDDSFSDLIDGLSADGHLGYEDFLREGNFKAFAISPNGAWGYAYGYETPFEANQEAIATCEEYAAQETNETTIDPSCELFVRE